MGCISLRTSHISLMVMILWNHQLASGLILLSSSSAQFDATNRKPKVHENNRQSPNTNTLPQTNQDQDLTKWLEEAGVLLGPESGRRVQISTVDKSVGGRGLFWAPTPAHPNPVAQQGDILAHIPSRLVLLPSNMQASYPCMFHDNNTHPARQQTSEDGSSFSWQSVLTTYVWKALQASHKPSDNTATPNWREWISTWGTDSSVTSSDTLICGPQAPKPVETFSDDTLGEMARLTQSKVALVKELIENKYATFDHDWKSVKELIAEDCDRDMDDKMKQEFAELYSSVLSRTANLGPEWGNQMGIIPLHDMINHPPFGKEANVELFCFGDIRSMIGNDGLKMLLRPLLTQDQLQGKVKPPAFMDHDFVIAARKRIDAGDELLLSYKSNEGEMSEKEQLWLLLQYGFPFRPAAGDALLW